MVFGEKTLGRIKAAILLLLSLGVLFTMFKSLQPTQPTSKFFFSEEENTYCEAIQHCSEEVWRGTCDNGFNVVVIELQENNQFLASKVSITEKGAFEATMEDCYNFAEAIEGE